MGNDGGSIPTRRELVKSAATQPSTAQLKETQASLLEYHWSTCALSQKPLIKPIVSDGAGDLYRKDAVLEFLIGAKGKDEKAEASDDAKGTGIETRVKSLKDVVEVQFQESVQDGAGVQLGRGADWICPLTNKVLGPSTKAVYLVPCGHAFSENAVKETPGQGTCLTCETPFEPEHVIPILPAAAAEKQRLVQRLEDLRLKGLAHSLKKEKAASNGKKRKKGIENGEVAVVGNHVEEKLAREKASSGINNSTTSLTAKMIAEESDRIKRRRNENLQSLFSSDKDQMAEKKVDFMTRGFSIPAGAKR